ncbi:MAG TPA: uroporphyrinogen decarboxylase family protein [bacterium]|nr:uroporphyrinogen decarboxylase family protein [bacterium]HOL66648.1 uroporphyrinogen decarboxylase family protein [bacterium]
MTPKEIVLEQIRHHETERVPYYLPFEPDVVTRLNAYYGDQDWQKRLVPYLVLCGGVVKAPREEIDQHHNRDVFGTVWRTDLLPSVVVEPGLKKPSFDGYRFPTPEDFFDKEVKAETIRKVRENQNSFTIVDCPCLWQAWYLRGFEQTLMDCVAEEDFYEELLERTTVLTLAFVDHCADIPADAIMMGDDWGNQQGVMIGPERWRRFYKPRYARIFQAIHRQGKIAIMHCCGSAAAIMADIVEIGLDVLESVQPEASGMNPYELKKAWGDRITFWGGLGSQSIIPFGRPEQLRQEIRRLRREMSQGGGYILAPAKPLRPETPTENAVAIVEEFLTG